MSHKQVITSGKKGNDNNKVAKYDFFFDFDGLTIKEAYRALYKFGGQDFILKLKVWS